MNFRIGKISGAAAAMLALLFSGCGMDREPIQFGGEHMQTVSGPTETPVRASTPQVPKLAKEDLFKVEVAVYSYLLRGKTWEAGDYSAVFVQGDDDELDALMKEFPHHVPPLKPSFDADMRPNRTPLDRQTGQAAMILNVDTRVSGADQVQAIGKWHAGGTVSGFYSFSLRKIGGDWVIESVK